MDKLILHLSSCVHLKACPTHTATPSTSYMYVPSKTGISFDERMLLHRDPEDDHPERPARLETLIQRFRDAGLLERSVHVQADAIIAEELLSTVHVAEYLAFMRDLHSTLLQHPSCWSINRTIS